MAEYQFLAKTNELENGQMKLLELDDQIVILFRQNDQFYCLDDVCTHDGGTLSDGNFCEFAVACPRHGAKFDIRDGAALTMPATEKTNSHEVKIDGEDVFVKIVEE